MRVIKLLLFNVILLNSAFAQEQISLSSYYIPGLVDSTEKGVMIDMLKKIELIAQVKFQLSLMPTKRVQQSFLHREITGYFPELEELRDPNSCRTSAFMQKAVMAFTRVNDKPITQIKQLENRPIGAVMGYSYGSGIINNPKITLTRANNDLTNVKKLLAGRIDIILGDMHSTIAAIKALNVEKLIHVEQGSPVNLLDVFFVFTPDEIGQSRCNKISIAIEKLKQSDDLYRWFGYR